ncbi:coiled-coil domain-containing protein 22 homolog [Prorops nasuta]|uniref:coiled-coil domain-containing protein 22 homolog n=1 Tax=Prorops nasuta TaxID=863751 RepID=UPI0034CDAC16
MEEVDNIIIHSLRQIGCDIEESISNLSSFSTELVVEATVRCLETIKPGSGLSTVLPVNMAARFRLGASLAQACTEIGYRGDIGYQTFLYSSEADLRRVLMFLIEKLPKESDKTITEPTSKMGLLEKTVASSLLQSLSAPWLPHYCHKRGFRNKGRASVPYKSVNIEMPMIDKNDEYRDYYIHYQQPVPDQMQNQSCLLPSIISYNGRAINACSKDITEYIEWLNNIYHQDTTPNNLTHNNSNINKSFSFKEKLQVSTASPLKGVSSITTVSPREELTSEEQKHELEAEAIKTECENLRTNLESLQDEIRQLNTRLAQVKIACQNEEKELKLKEENTRIKKKMYDLLENGEENVKKLETAIEASTNKLLNLAHQWEKHRVPLIEKYRDEREKHSSKATASQKKIDDIKLLKEKEKILLEECRNKDQQYSQLVADVQKLPKEVNRSAYTQRILEIINNVRKQRDEINKVLADTREIQKEINTLTGRLERSFTVVDELIFRDARTNEASRKAYKLLATLHSDCSELVNLVEETGATVREIRDLEEQIDSESSKKVGANLERITADLKQMQQETAALTAQLQNKNT